MKNLIPLVHPALLMLMAVFAESCSRVQEKMISVRPNIILFLADDQGWGDLGFNGNRDVMTPNLDALAQNGAVLENFYVCPVCSPTRAELLTGRYHVRGGISSTSSGGERLDLDEITLAEILKQNGFATAAYGKWHNGMQYPYHPNARGFDDYYGFCSGHWGNYFDPVLEHNGELVRGNGFIPDDLTDKALAFMEANATRPFFLFVPFNTPHSPMQVSDSLWDTFKNKELTMDHRYRNQEDILFTRAAYALNQNIDWNVGRVMDKLAKLGLEENTIVIYLSDNGPAAYRWNGDMKGRKGYTDEGGVRAPCIVQWKGKIKAGKKIESIAGAIDILPTIADLAGIHLSPVKALDGISLKSWLLGEHETRDDRYLVNYWNHNISIRSQQFRLDHENKLFDIKQDRGQRQDVSGLYPDQYHEMVLFKEKWEQEVLSELPDHDLRPFTVGQPGYEFTQLPARDAIPHGNIRRSNQYPNCSFFTNWTSTDDRITWNIEVPEAGAFETVVYYTCAKEYIGSLIKLQFGTVSIEKRLTLPHDPPLFGFEKDRVKRIESYVKDFIPFNMGIIALPAGKGELVLSATDIKGKEVMDFRLIMLKRICWFARDYVDDPEIGRELEK